MAICTNCGNDVPAGQKFCTGCGTPVNAVPEAAPEPVAAEAPAAPEEAPAYVAPAPAAPVAPQAPEPPVAPAPATPAPTAPVAPPVAPAPAPAAPVYQQPAPAPAPAAPAYQQPAPAPAPAQQTGYTMPQPQPKKAAPQTGPAAMQPQQGVQVRSQTPLGVGGFLITLIVLAIPIVGFILCIVWAINAKNVNRRNLSRAYLILFIIGIVISILMYIFAGAIINKVLGPELTQTLLGGGNAMSLIGGSTDDDSDDSSGGGLFGDLLGGGDGSGISVGGGGAMGSLIDWMKDGTYSYDYRQISEYEGTTSESSGSMTASGGNLAVITNADGQNSRVIIKDGTMYLVMDDQQLVMTLGAGDIDLSDMGMFDYSKIELIGEGTGDVDGKTLPYEEYAIHDDGSEDINVKYYMEGGQVYAIESSWMGSKSVMIITNASGSARNEMFEIPSDYMTF